VSAEQNAAINREVLNRAFNQGDVTVFDQYMAPNGIDHQEPPGTDFIAHLKSVAQGLRTAFPDLHFEIHDLLAEGNVVAFRSTMTGTHTGILALGRGQPVPPTGRPVAVPHMYFVTMQDGKVTDLWHIWNIPLMMQQLGIGMEAPAQHR